MRGHPADFDYWASAKGCEGWAYEDVLPYFIKSERNTNPVFAQTVYHGDAGPMVVSDTNQTNPNKLQTVFLDAGRELGFSVGDINADHDHEGLFMHNQVYH